MEFLGPLARNIIAFGTVFLLSLSLTSLVCSVSRQMGFVSKPIENRWNSRTVSLGGGIAIHLSLFGGILALQSKASLLLLPGLLLVFILGFIDDVWGVPPIGKLICQALAASLLASQGYTLPLPWPVISIALTVIWLVGMTNAVNLIDNMDGLAAGFCLIAGLTFSFLLYQQGDQIHSGVALALAAASAGFLIPNFYPSRIFMGDTGSLTLGFALAALATKIRFQSEVHQGFTFVPLALLLALPVFDTALVMIARRSANRPLMVGGRDHTSHRLVALGLGEKKAVLILYLFTAGGALAALVALRGNATLLIMISVLSVIVLSLFSVFLLEIVVYPPSYAASGKARNRNLPLSVLYLGEIATDICAFSLAWTLAHMIRFYDQGNIAHYRVSSVIPSLPFLISVKLIAFWAFKLYRGFWKTMMTRDVYLIFKASGFGTILLMIGLVFAVRLADVSRVVLLLDFLLTFIIALGIRAAIIGFGRWSRKLVDEPFQAALLGAPGMCDAIQNAIRNDPSISFAGVISTDEAGSIPPNEAIGNAQFLGTATNLEDVIEKHGIDMLLVATNQFEPLISSLSARGIIIRQVRIVLA